MKCKKCGIENDASAKFCRACGASLDSNPLENIKDKYPKYEFVPTNLIEWEKPKLSRLIFCIFLIGCVISLVTSIYFFCSYNWYYIVDIDEREPSEYSDKYRAEVSDYCHLVSDYEYGNDRSVWLSAKAEFQEECIPFIIVFGILSIFAGGICYIVFRPYPSSSTKSIRTYADYIQKYTYTGIFSSRSKPMFRFYVKDNKFGLMDVSHYKVYLNAEYDFLSWREKGKFLTAHQGNRVFIIDINGKELK